MNRLYRVLLALTLVFGWLGPTVVAAAPQPTGTLQTATPPDQSVAKLVASLSPQEKVGQLFLVTFRGTAVDANSPVVQLLTQYHVGGVALQAANDNFTDQDFPNTTNHLTTSLQAVAAGVAPTASGTPTPTAVSGNFIPLFITTSYDEANLSNRLQLPTAMTLGATWSLERATTVGRLVGQDIAALGINFLFGPPLDVVTEPQPLGPADQGADIFGGNPYWVGTMGQAFMDGVHQGSDGHVAVIAQHFPGYGAGYRTLDEQIPSVNGSRDHLFAIYLAPLF